MALAGMTILATNGQSNHKPQSWAEKTVEHMMKVDPESARAPAGLRLRADIIEILTESHQKIQEFEKKEIEKRGLKRLTEGFEIPMVRETLDKIIAKAANSGFEDDFAKPEYQDYLLRVLAKHFAASMNVERALVADKNPDAPESKAWRNRRDGAPAENQKPKKK